MKIIFINTFDQLKHFFKHFVIRVLNRIQFQFYASISSSFFSACSDQHGGGMGFFFFPT